MVVAAKQKQKTTTHHRKRSGTHQKRNTHFMKAYWPYLPMALIVGVSIVFNSLVLQPNVLGYATNMSSAGLLSATNNERTQRGLGSLAVNSLLTQAAQAKAQDMANRNYWSHNTPDGEEPWVFITRTGYQYMAAGENLAYGFLNSSDTVVGWMNSPGHRANILNSDYSEVGFGIVNSANYQSSGEQTIVVAMYAKPVTVAKTNPTPSPAPAQPTPVADTTPSSSSDPTRDTDEQPIAVAPQTKTEDAPEQSDSNKLVVSATVPGQQKVARVQLATSGAAPWSLFAASSLAVLLALFWVTRHSVAWHRAVVRGEKFFLKHKVLDFFIVGAVMIAAIASQTAGFIQ